MEIQDQILIANTRMQPVAALKAFCFPGGDAAARRVRSLRTTERGEMRMSPKGRWIPFTSESRTDTTQSGFRWSARLNPGKLTTIAVTDEYERGHGHLIAKTAGIVKLIDLEGRDTDMGEIQRYLSSIAFCPSILLNHCSLECIETGPDRVRLRDKNDLTGASVEIGISAAGEPLSCHADRPRAVGKRTILTPWSGTYAGFQESEGLRVATRLEVSWHLPEGLFSYYRSEITSFTAIF
jgi:hypothetical protein